MSRARARAHANIALVKYWGKRNAALNLPAAGSLSLTLEALSTETEVTFGSDRDSLSLDGEEVTGAGLDRLSQWLDIVRGARSGQSAEQTGELGGARVVSTNNFPTASGLASSASAYAALAVAASAAAGLDSDGRALSVLARRGSGSAARSIFGGLVQWHRGERGDGSDSFAETIKSKESLQSWPLAMVVAIVGGGVKKSISSRQAMTRSADTSPLYRGWVDSVAGDLIAARVAIDHQDIEALGVVCERSALTMHAAALASRPAIRYFKAPTIALMDRVLELRASGIPAYFTMDAGPHVKTLTLAKHASDVGRALREVDGVTDIIESGIGGPAELVGAS